MTVFHGRIESSSVEKTLREARETEHHFHVFERWVGQSTDQTGNNWAKETILTPYTVASSGVDTWSTGVYAKVLGTTDTPIISGMVKFDPHRVMVSNVSSTKPANYKFRWIHGGSTQTMVGAISTGAYSEFVFRVDPDKGAKSIPGGPVDIRMKRFNVGDKCWMQLKSTEDAVTASFFVGIHEYTI